MPGVYRKKNCPQCGVEHRKRGPFCSQACSNSHREVTDHQREHGKKMGQQNAGRPDLIAQGHQLKAGTFMKAEEYGVNIPDIPDLPEGYDIADKW